MQPLKTFPHMETVHLQKIREPVKGVNASRLHGEMHTRGWRGCRRVQTRPWLAEVHRVYGAGRKARVRGYQGKIERKRWIESVPPYIGTPGGLPPSLHPRTTPTFRPEAAVLRFSTFSRFIPAASLLNRFPDEIYGRAIIQQQERTGVEGGGGEGLRKRVTGSVHEFPARSPASSLPDWLPPLPGSTFFTIIHLFHPLQ